MSPLNAAICTTISYTLWVEWYYLKNNYLTLRSKVKVPRRYATHCLMVMHPHTKYIWPIWKDKKVMVRTSFAEKKQKRRKQKRKVNKFLHTFLGKTGWSSTSNRNSMSFREWSAANRTKRNTNFYHEWKITRAFPTTHVSTYFFRKPTTFTIANS